MVSRLAFEVAKNGVVSHVCARSMLYVFVHGTVWLLEETVSDGLVGSYIQTYILYVHVHCTYVHTCTLYSGEQKFVYTPRISYSLLLNHKNHKPKHKHAFL